MKERLKQEAELKKEREAKEGALQAKEEEMKIEMLEMRRDRERNETRQDELFSMLKEQQTHQKDEISALKRQVAKKEDVPAGEEGSDKLLERPLRGPRENANQSTQIMAGPPAGELVQAG